MPSGPARHLWPVAAVAVFTVAAVLTMRPWLDPRLLPGNDFPGFAAEVEWTRVTLDRLGTLPAWTPDRFGGSTRFMSNLKEIATYPLATLFGAVHGTKLMFLLMRIAGAFGVYLLCARHLRSPPAGLVAGYAYGFGAPANLQSGLGGHLDLVISSALFPLILLAAAAMLQRRRRRDAVVLGVLVAVEFCVHSYLQAMTVPVIVLLLLWLRPWRRDPREDGLAEPALVRRWLGLGATALVVFLLLGASQIAWLAGDLANHRLLSPEEIAHGLRTYVEHSPLMYVNRGDWLGGWLADHRPPAMLVAAEDPLFNQRRYLGVVALLTCAAGWLWARADFSLRRWFQAFLLLFGFQYWMAIGPHTLVWQLGRSLHWPESVDGPLRVLLSLGAAACLAWGTVLVRRRRRDPAATPFARVELACGLGLVQLAAAHSLFGALAAFIPIFAGMRSPGHFFDLAPFPFFAMLGVAVAAALGRVAPRTRAALVLALGAALVLDYLPTLRAFERRRDDVALETMRQTVATLPGDGGSLRVAVFRASSDPAASLVTAGAAAGSAWSWLGWQAGRHWEPYVSAAMASFSPDAYDPRTAPAMRRLSDALVRSGRFRWVLEEFYDVPRLRIEPPWIRLAETGTFALWSGPEVLPMGTVFGAFVLFVGGTDWEQAPAIATAFERGMLGVAGGSRLSDSDADVVASAAIIRVMGTDALGDPASRALAARHAETLLDTRDASAPQRWSALLDAAATATPSAALYSRLAPDRMVLEVDAGPRPAILFVSEAHHPWWRARVDGTPAEVLRAAIAFMAVRVPAGSHRVELELRPPLALRAADRATQLSWIALGGALLVAGMRAARGRNATRAPRPSRPDAPS